MRLQRIEIAGFKSFPDRAELTFDQGVTAIVGPNGCGKSNVVDAITWVLGEQSAKSLRGERMEDVIFAGSDARKPTISPPAQRFSSTTSPPCSLAIERAKVRPSPAPPVAALRDASSLTNGSNTSSSLFSGMPGPLSFTVTTKLSPSVTSDTRATLP